MILWKLFFVFFRIGLFAIGGAYSFLPLIERETVENFQWLSKEEFLDVLGSVEIFPGAISIKYATYVGYKLAGIMGAVCANIGNILAPAVCIVFASALYARYRNQPAVKDAFVMVRIAVFTMILAIALKLISFHQLLHVRNMLIALACLCLFMFTKIHPAFIIIGAGIVGILWR